MNVLLLAACVAASAGGLKPLAHDLTQGARGLPRAKAYRVAVLPFAPSDASPSGDGTVIAERLLVELARAGGVTAVERSRLSGLLDEQSLGRSGVMDPASLRKLGRVLSADAVVVGSYTTARGRSVVSARLVDVESGAIMAAGEGRLARDWLPSGPTSCAEASARADVLERSVLEPKARLWARRLRDGLSFADAARMPGADIGDAERRWDFYDRIRELYAAGQVRALDAEELSRVETVERELRSLHDLCARTNG